MKSDYCDWEPCPWLKKLVESLLVKGSGRAVVVQVQSKPLRKDPIPHAPRRLSLWYCPFCGTRIYDNKEILDWVERRRGIS